MKLKHVELPLEVKSFDEETGVFEGYGNVANFKDYAKDVAVNGAFQKSLDRHKAKGSTPAMLFQHKHDSAIGVWTEIREDQHGLYVKGKFTKGVQLADETYLLMKDGALSGLSIGYSVIDQEYDAKTETNYLKEVELFEISVVTFPCNDRARIQTVKSAFDEGELPTKSEIEELLRDAGFSRKQAKGFISKGYSIFEGQRDAESEEVQEAKEDLDSDLIIKALEDLRTSIRASE